MVSFKNKIVVALTLITGSPIVFSNPNLTAEDMEMVRQSKRISENAQQNPFDLPENPYQSQAWDEARDVFSVIKRNNSQLFNPNQTDPALQSNNKLLLFVSHKMGDSGLKLALASAAGKSEITLVLRGIPEGKSIGKELLKIQKLALQNGTKADVIIDPTLFQKHNVYTVPVQVMTGTDGEQIARVTGITDPLWLMTRVKAGKLEDFGTVGPTSEISEPDLVEVMKAKSRAIDWEKKKEQALARFWDKQTFYSLPSAPKENIKYIDPTVVITRDITAPNGNIIAFAGTRINPLDLRPFNQAIIVFDATNPSDLSKAFDEYQKLKDQKKVTLLTTRFDRVKGWDDYRSLTEMFNAPVFLLSKDIKDRFKVEYVPSVITADDKQFIVHEHMRPAIPAKKIDDQLVAQTEVTQ